MLHCTPFVKLIHNHSQWSKAYNCAGAQVTYNLPTTNVKVCRHLLVWSLWFLGKLIWWDALGSSFMKATKTQLTHDEGTPTWPINCMERWQQNNSSTLHLRSFKTCNFYHSSMALAPISFSRAATRRAASFCYSDVDLTNLKSSMAFKLKVTEITHRNP